jgi:hypothetical protein
MWINRHTLRVEFPPRPRDGRQDEGKQKESLRRTQEFARLFLFAGVGHCSGGVGPDTVDGHPLPAGPIYPARPALDPLEQRVEHGTAPIKSLRITSQMA